MVYNELEQFDDSRLFNFYAENNGVTINNMTLADLSNLRLIYVGNNSAKVIEHAGRICYNSYDKVTENSFIGFIKGIVMSGHESVIEHTTLVYAIRPINSVYANVCQDICKVVTLNPLVKINQVENGIILISGNLRIFKDLCRNWKESNINSIMISNIMESFYSMPKFFFEDMISKGLLEGEKFLLVEKPIKIDMYEDIKPIQISDKVKLISSSLLYVNKKILPRESILTFEIEEPRYTSHQEVRHRISSYSQQSQRYINFSKGSCYIPEHLDDSIKNVLESKFEDDFDIYNKLVNMGVKKEDARTVLPEATMSRLIVTRNIENWKHYLHERTNPRAQEYIREKIAKPISQYCKSLNII